MPYVVGLITARGGSKSVPRKNVRLLAGKPLIAWTIQVALVSPDLARVIVSTDDPEIAHVSRLYGAEVPFLRPQHLAQDATPHIDVVEHAIGWLTEDEGRPPEYVMLLQPTAPLRAREDIAAAIALAATHDAPGVVSVCEVERHPYLAKRILADGTTEDLIPSSIQYKRRQDLPPAFYPNGAIYLDRCAELLEHRSFWPPGTLAYVMPPERSLDLDSTWDFFLAEMVLKGGYVDAADH
ncbi:MAG: acylneuraminate cytidylyltransferase family protein [Anaerolineae bacterium]|nr:acylneuraminate cytidylyltransferase family protein [Anaerolineae bacterium]